MKADREKRDQERDDDAILNKPDKWRPLHMSIATSSAFLSTLFILILVP